MTWLGFRLSTFRRGKTTRWHLYREVDEQPNMRNVLNVEVSRNSWTPRLSVGAEAGGALSDTPFSTHVVLGGAGLFLSTDYGRRLAARITKETEHPRDGRTLQAFISDGRLCWHLWTHPDSWKRGEFAAWREKSVHVSPFGPVIRQDLEKVATATVDIELPDGNYPVTVTLERTMWGRSRWRRGWATRWDVDVDSEDGIPVYPDRGWKGDSVYGFGVSAPARLHTDTGAADGWARGAASVIAAWVLKERAESGWGAA